jgi:hypothetical protein
MAITHKKKAAARARAGRWANQTAYPPEQTFNNNSLEVSDCSPELKTQSDKPIILDLDSGSDLDCGYNGGINYWPDSDSDEDWSEDWTGDSNSEEGSLVEFDEDDLVEFNEDNLEELKAELKDLCTPLPYDQITEIK